MASLPSAPRLLTLIFRARFTAVSVIFCRDDRRWRVGWPSGAGQPGEGRVVGCGAPPAPAW